MMRFVVVARGVALVVMGKEARVDLMNDLAAAGLQDWEMWWDIE